VERRQVAQLSTALTLLAAIAASGYLVANSLEVRYERDVSRMVFNDNVELLDDLRRRAGLEIDSLSQLLVSSPELQAESSYLVVSIEDHRLWYRKGDSVLFTTQVATGSGKILESSGSVSRWRFETPRGRLVVVSRDTNPVWVPPDWYYVEEAIRRGLGIVRLNRGQSLTGPNGAILTVVGSDVVRRARGESLTEQASEGHEIVFGGNLVIPPFGTKQRKYSGVLGTYRLNLGDGYALHGTDKPESIGRSVSHGCVRLRNEDIGWLYANVPIGTPVYIY